MKNNDYPNKPGVTGKNSKYPREILEDKIWLTICNIADHLHNTIAELKPAMQKNDQDIINITNIISSSFAEIQLEIRSVKIEKDKKIIAEKAVHLICLKRTLLLKYFGNNATWLDKTLGNIGNCYCTQNRNKEEYFIELLCEFFVNKLPIEIEDDQYGEHCNFIEWIGNQSQLKTLKFEMENSGFFIGCMKIDKILKNMGSEKIINCRPTQKEAAAWLFHQLIINDLFRCHGNKGYFEVLARFTYCNDEQVTVKDLNNWSSKIKLNPGKYSRIHSAVDSIIQQIKAKE